MKHRAGLTLIEVLVAIFIMGVGMLAILTLFPLGLMTAGQAMQDDRVVQLVSNMSAIANARNLRTDSNILAAFNNGNQSAVLVDPFYAGMAPTFGDAYPPVVTPANPGIPRVTVSWSNPNRWFTLVDDYSFQQSAIPENTAGVIESNGDYTCCCLLRRPRAGDASLTSLSVLVYKGRTTAYAAGEISYQASGASGTTSIVVNVLPGQTVLAADQDADLTKLKWIMDTTPDPNTGQPIAQCYRVISITGGAGQFTLETQIPLKNNVSVVLGLSKVVEVVEKGFGKP
jgi:prepilin-type N-terminal cleavage/methylation domain-containing protein